MEESEAKTHRRGHYITFLKVAFRARNNINFQCTRHLNL
jgi:hypothetical protein